MAYHGKMGRITRLGSIGGIVAVMHVMAVVAMAVALVAHLWMFPSLAGSSPAAHAPHAPHATHATQATHDMAPVASITDGPLSTASCLSGMSACVAAPAEEARLPLALATGPLAIVLWALRDRRSPTRPRTRSCDDDRAPPLSPVTARVLLLE